MEYHSSRGKIVLNEKASKEILEELRNPEPMSPEKAKFMRECMRAGRIHNRRKTVKEVVALIEEGILEEELLQQIEEALQKRRT